MLDLLLEVGLLESKSTDTLIVQNHGLGEFSDQVSADKGRYQRLEGETHLFVSYSPIHRLRRECGESIYALF